MIRKCSIIAITALTIFCSANTLADEEEFKLQNNNMQNLFPQAPQFDVKAYILMEYESGQILAGKNYHDRISPASLTKMLTSYEIGKRISEGKLNNNDYVSISNNAWSKNYSDSSKMFIEVGKQITVGELNQGIIVASGNDACIAMAEHIAGTEKAFVEILNNRAKEIGLNESHFVNSHGLYDENHYSTAYDMAILSRALITDVPNEYAIYSQKEFTFNGIKQKNRNRLLWDNTIQVDGIKTGHLSQVGYNLASSAVSPIHKNRLIAVIIGDTSDKNRAIHSKQLLEYGIKFFEPNVPLKANEVITTKEIRFGVQDTVKLGVNKDIRVLIPTGSQNRLKASFALNKKRISAPIKVNDVLGTLTLSLDGITVTKVDIVALETVEEAGFFSRLWDTIVITVQDWFE